MKRISGKLKSPRFLILVATTVITLFYTFMPSFQSWVSSNVTFVDNWEKETRMSSTVLIVFGILLVGSWVYLIYDALKESDSERLEKKLDTLIEEIRKNQNGNTTTPK